jgi:hypothetical protein
MIVAMLFVAIGTPMYMQGCSQNEGTSNLPARITGPVDADSNLDDGIGTDENQTPDVAYRLSSDPRQAVKLECFYALSQAINGYSTKSINGNAVSNWNFMANDLNAYNVMKSRYGSNASVWGLYYSNPASYGCYGGYGRGGQCVHFVNLILYRSSVYQGTLPSYATCLANYNSSRSYTKPFRQLRVGDIIRSYSANGHTAIVVAILAGVEGSSVTSVDVIDANFVGGMGNEIIARHIISTSGSGYGDLDNYYAVDLIALGGR